MSLDRLRASCVRMSKYQAFREYLDKDSALNQEQKSSIKFEMNRRYLDIVPEDSSIHTIVEYSRERNGTSSWWSQCVSQYTSILNRDISINSKLFDSLETLERMLLEIHSLPSKRMEGFMERIKFSDWLAAKVMDANETLVNQLASKSDHPCRALVTEYFRASGLKITEEKLNAAKGLIAMLAPDRAEEIKTISMSDFVSKVSPVPYSIIAMTSNPNGHNYGSEYFMTVRFSSGYKQDGTGGNSFPAYEDSPWKIATPDELPGIIKKYLEKAKTDCEFREYILALRMFGEPFIDFSEIL